MRGRVLARRGRGGAGVRQGYHAKGERGLDGFLLLLLVTTRRRGHSKALRGKGGPQRQTFFELRDLKCPFGIQWTLAVERHKGGQVSRTVDHVIHDLTSDEAEREDAF